MVFGLPAEMLFCLYKSDISSADNLLEYDRCWCFMRIRKVPRILLVWHRLRDSVCYWSHPSVVGTPETECGACISFLFTGIPTRALLGHSGPR